MTVSDWKNFDKTKNKYIKFKSLNLNFLKGIHRCTTFLFILFTFLFSLLSCWIEFLFDLKKMVKKYFSFFYSNIQKSLFFNYRIYFTEKMYTILYINIRLYFQIQIGPVNFNFYWFRYAASFIFLIGFISSIISYHLYKLVCEDYSK